MRRLLPLIMLPLVGCASMTTEQFKSGKPTMALEEYFNGDSTAYGMFFNRSGDVKRQFKVAMHGAWDGAVLKLDENFTYDDGEKQERHWSFHKTGSNTWEGTAPDVIGPAIGRFDGNAYRMTYTVDLKAGDTSYRVDFDDWLFRQSDKIVLNNAKVSKFGLEVGQVQLVFVR